MRSLGSVQHKIPCVFLTEVKEEPSRKRDCQVNTDTQKHLETAADKAKTKGGRVCISY